MNSLLLRISNPLIRSHIRAWLISAVTYLALYVGACVANQTPAIHNFVVGTLNALQSFIPALSGIVENGQIIPAKLAGLFWLILSAAILPALLRIPWIQRNQLADEIVTDAEEVAQTAPIVPIRQPEAVADPVEIPNKAQGGLGPIKIVIATLFLSFTAASAQITIIQHKEFKTWFDQAKHEPIYVEWTLAPSMLPKDHLPRTNKFVADPQIPGTNLARDYANSGYDQGHQMPAQDAASDQQAETECFYFSNMEPQVPELNRVTWKDLEMWCRHEVTTTGNTLTIVCGGGNFAGAIGPDKVAIPAYCWKAIKENGKWTAYLFPNVATVKNKPFTEYAINIKDLDAKIGTQIETMK